jgi:alpha(1,3/1,4) fucosyltransferase
LKISFYNIYEILNKDNFLFENDNVSIGDNLMSPFLRMNEYAKNNNIELGTIDKIPIFDSDVIVFVDCPNKNKKILMNAIRLKKPLYLIIFETSMINYESHNKENHKFFKKIFTWSDVLIKENPNKYIKINFSYDIPKKINKNLKNKKKLCCMIAGNKKINFKNELYSKRKEIIKWFELNHLEDFDLYGFGWDEVAIGSNKYINYILRRSQFLRIFFGVSYKSYRGSIDRKNPILKKYRFSICFENIYNLPGYITEKIFDSFFAGCVPIYLGAGNINKYIPENCFIDMRKFNGIAEVYNFISKISDDDYLNYLNNIESFLNSEDASQFSSKKFSKTIINEFIE